MMTTEEKLKREIDALRTEIHNLRNKIEQQDRAIQMIASKVAEVRGGLATLQGRMR